MTQLQDLLNTPPDPTPALLVPVVTTRLIRYDIPIIIFGRCMFLLFFETEKTRYAHLATFLLEGFGRGFRGPFAVSLPALDATAGYVFEVHGTAGG